MPEKPEKPENRGSPFSITVPLKFSYECGCRGEPERGRIDICCPSHGDILCVNGHPMDMMRIADEALELLMHGAPVPGQIDLNRHTTCGRRQLRS